MFVVGDKIYQMQLADIYLPPQHEEVSMKIGHFVIIAIMLLYGFMGFEVYSEGRETIGGVALVVALAGGTSWFVYEVSSRLFRYTKDRLKQWVDE
jgi:hypothetical protein